KPSSAQTSAAPSSSPNTITSTSASSSVQLLSAFRWITPTCPRTALGVVNSVSIFCPRLPHHATPQSPQILPRVPIPQPIKHARRQQQHRRPGHSILEHPISQTSILPLALKRL